VTRPRILITVDTGTAHRRGVPFPEYRLKQAYAAAVERAGGLPLLVAPTVHPEVLQGYVDLMQGLVVTGGYFDISPALYGAEDSAERIDPKKPERTQFEWALVQAALKRRRPLLGICGGMQLLNVVLGGTLLQDIQEALPEALDHEQASSPAEPGHPVHVVAGSPFEALCGGRSEIEVNSTHHQAVQNLGRGLLPWGHAPDGVIEAFGMADQPAVCGVQWHPELLADSVSNALYEQLVRAAQG